jgi:hypothetical protein
MEATPVRRCAQHTQSSTHALPVVSQYSRLEIFLWTTIHEIRPVVRELERFYFYR